MAFHPQLSAVIRGKIRLDGFLGFTFCERSKSFDKATDDYVLFKSIFFALL
jgi:hypothetical protein